MPLHNIRKLWLNNTTTSTLVPKNISCGSTTCPGATAWKAGAAYGTSSATTTTMESGKSETFRRYRTPPKSTLMRNASMKYSPSWRYKPAMPFGGKMLACFIFRNSQACPYLTKSSAPYTSWKTCRRYISPSATTNVPPKNCWIKTDKERHMQAWQKDVTDTILHLSLPRLFIPP